MAFVFPTIYPLSFFSLFYPPDLLLCYERDRLFLSFSEGTRIPRACESPEGTRPCRERKRRIALVSLPSTPTALCSTPFVRSPRRARRGPRTGLGRIRYLAKGALQPAPAPLSFLRPLLLTETNCSRVLQPFRREGHLYLR